MTQPHSKDDVLRMADRHADESAAAFARWDDETHEFHRDTAAMLCAYAEVVAEVEKSVWREFDGKRYSVGDLDRTHHGYRLIDNHEKGKCPVIGFFPSVHEALNIARSLNATASTSRGS